VPGGEDRIGLMQSRATYDDANLVLKLYDMRREERLRKARAWFAGNFKGVASIEHFLKLCAPGTDENASFRMVTTYWDMAASFVTNGVLSEALFYESGRELLFVWERSKDYVAAVRQAHKDQTYLRNLETVGNSFANRFRTASPDGYDVFVRRVRGQ
jgi:hypothetical protein